MRDTKVVQTGFTLIELVVVIVILGILAAVVVPRFVDLSADAENATAQAIAGAASSASSINYATSRLPAAAGRTVVTIAVNGTCSDVINALVDPDVDTSRYTISSAPIAADQANPALSSNCTIASRRNGATAYPVVLFLTQ